MPKTKPWEKGTLTTRPKRKIQRYLIVCEDKKSGADYLRSFKVSSELVEIVIEGGAGNTDGLVQRALNWRQAAIDRKEPYAGVWCVFDRDEFPLKNFNRAFEIAGPYRDVHIIWSNESFELWYLLHFELRETPIGRVQIIEELEKSTRLGSRYKKVKTPAYDLLKDKTEIAIKNARILCDRMDPKYCNPSTRVHVLVRRLLDLQGA